MPSSQPVDVLAVPEYLGRGTDACRIVTQDGRSGFDRVAVDAGAVFGGDAAVAQTWHVVEGEGDLSHEGEYTGRRPVRAGHVEHLGANHRALLVARSPMVVELRYAFGKGPEAGPLLRY
jgi:hypothetical protein